MPAGSSPPAAPPVASKCCASATALRNGCAYRNGLSETRKRSTACLRDAPSACSRRRTARSCRGRGSPAARKARQPLARRRLCFRPRLFLVVQPLDVVRSEKVHQHAPRPRLRRRLVPRVHRQHLRRPRRVAAQLRPHRVVLPRNATSAQHGDARTSRRKRRFTDPARPGAAQRRGRGMRRCTHDQLLRRLGLVIALRRRRRVVVREGSAPSRGRVSRSGRRAACDRRDICALSTQRAVRRRCGSAPHSACLTSKSKPSSSSSAGAGSSGSPPPSEPKPPKSSDALSRAAASAASSAAAAASSALLKRSLTTPTRSSPPAPLTAPHMASAQPARGRLAYSGADAQRRARRSARARARDSRSEEGER